MQKPLLLITKSAGDKIANILSKSPDTPHFRVQIKGGGCSGFEYQFGIDQEIKKRDFHQQYTDTDKPFTIVVDSISYQYIKNAKIDYKTDASGERFTVDNPNAQTSCSCGSSFSPKEDQ